MANEARHIQPVGAKRGTYSKLNARASHWLEEGMNIVEISVLLGHEQLATTMRYLDISTDNQIKAMATLEDENDSRVSTKWKNNNNGSLKSMVARQ